MNSNNIFITTIWHNMDIIELTAEKKGYPLQDSAEYKEINHKINKWAESKGKDVALMFDIAFLLGKLSEKIAE